MRDLELPNFTPSPKVSVSTWIDRVDLALRGAEESGRGTWSDSALYYILGNKLMENAATWWINMNRRLPERKRTWSRLKKLLLRRYGVRLDKSQAEWRVNNCQMLPGESYGDFAARLREVVGRNRVSERVLLAQFYRCLDKTTRQLVKQDPKPRFLEKAVEKTNRIDDPMDNVARGMANAGLPFATAPSSYLVPMAGTTGQTVMIPGIGGAGLPVELNQIEDITEEEGAARTGAESLALFTNPQGVYNAFAGIWEPPSGHVWNGKYWQPKTKVVRKRQTKSTAARPQTDELKLKKKPKIKREEATTDDEAEQKHQRKKLKAAVKQAGAEDTRQVQMVQANQAAGRTNTNGTAAGHGCFRCGQAGHWASQCPKRLKCFICNQSGHFARDCSSEEGRAYRERLTNAQTDKQKTDAATENEQRAP